MIRENFKIQAAFCGLVHFSSFYCFISGNLSLFLFKHASIVLTLTLWLGFEFLKFQWTSFSPRQMCGLLRKPTNPNWKLQIFLGSISKIYTFTKWCKIVLFFHKSSKKIDSSYSFFFFRIVVGPSFINDFTNF